MQMNQVRKIFSFSMATLLLVSALSACGSDSAGAPSDTTVPAETEAAVTTAAPETTGKYLDALPEKMDLGGYEYRVLIFDKGNKDDASWKAYIDIDEQTGEVLNDAAVKRNREVEDRLNVKISAIEKGVLMETAKELSNAVLAMEDICDVAIMQHSKTATGALIQTGAILDVTTVPHMDLSQPYYLQTANDIFTLDGKQYFFSGDMLASLYSTVSVWTNMDLWKQYGLEDPYKLVDEGKWTLEKCFSLAKNVYMDLNNNGTADREDRFGITGVNATLAYCFHSAGGNMFESNGNTFFLPVTSEHNINILTRLVAELENPDCFWKDSSSTYQENYFNGNSLMFFSGKSITLLRDAQFSTGLLPFPKYDEKQENYRTLLAGAMMCVPVTNQNLENTGIVTEAMFSESSRTVKPAFVDFYVDMKVLQDENSARMMTLVMDSGAHVFANYIDPSERFGGIAMITTLLNKGSNNISSSWDSIKDVVESGYKELYANLK